MNQSCCKVPRSLWLSALKQISVEEIKAVIEPIINQFEVNYLSLPQSGLGMLQVRDTALNEPYFLGEFPISTSHVALKDTSGNIFEGAAQLMDDEENLASLFAVCDAILANNLIACDKLADLVELGFYKIQTESHLRKSMLGSTAVDFSLLDASETENQRNQQQGDQRA